MKYFIYTIVDDESDGQKMSTARHGKYYVTEGGNLLMEHALTAKRPPKVVHSKSYVPDLHNQHRVFQFEEVGDDT